MDLITTHRAGVAAGVPYLALPPAGEPDPAAPIVVGWHLMDPPRTEAAFAAALPLTDLPAWRIYLGLPLCGGRTPAGGEAEIMRLGYEDAVRNLQGAVSAQAVAEFPQALAAVRDQLGLTGSRLGLLGGSLGAAVALQVLAEQATGSEHGDPGRQVTAVALVSPLVQLRAAVTALGRRYGVSYPWDGETDAIAARLDFVARADELARAGAPVRLLVGAEDDAEGFAAPAATLHAELSRRSVRARLDVITGMAHALAEAPGDEPAPQTPAARACDRLVTEWFAEHLV